MVDHPFADALFGLGRRRERLLAGARGRILELSGDPAANRPYYPDVDSVVTVDPSSPAFPPDSAGGGFDTVVSTLALCTVPDVATTLAAIRTSLAPDGQLLFLEHVRLPGMRGRWQHFVTPAWSRFAAGCHLDRDPIVALRDAGFVVTDCERFSLPFGNTLVGAAVQGAARPRSHADQAA